MRINMEFRSVRVNVRNLTFVHVFLTRTRVNCFIPFANGHFAVAILRPVGTIKLCVVRWASNVRRYFQVSNDPVRLTRSMGNGTSNVGLFLNVRQLASVVR